MQNSIAAAASTEARSHLRPRLVNPGELVHIDPVGSERADSGEVIEDGLAPVRGIMLGVAAGVSLWILVALGVRAMWGWLAA